ncbi:MAG: hypothetical protein WD904_05785 [Dehalococcoidia bacterium]
MSQLMIVALVPDLLTSVRVESAAQRLGARLIAVESESELAQELSRGGATLAIIDLGYGGLDLMYAVEACVKERVPVLAFGPHADAGRLRDARRAGAEFVYPRSKFMADATSCLREALATGAKAQTA